MTCTCRVCKLMSRIEPLLAKANKDERAAMETLFLDWEHCSTSAAYWEAKFNGTWPVLIESAEKAA